MSRAKGAAPPGSKQCLGLTPQLCDNGGKWQSGNACPNACLAGDCTDCSPGTQQCVNNTPATCQSDGKWSMDTACDSLEQCWNGQLCVAKLVAVTGGYSIDATEVTASQYQAWMATSPSATSLPAYCSAWKSGFSAGSGAGNYPVETVDWCDCYGYCLNVGKRLCGKIGGGSVGQTEATTASVDQWFNACSSGLGNVYPLREYVRGSHLQRYRHGDGSGGIPVGMPVFRQWVHRSLRSERQCL